MAGDRGHSSNNGFSNNNGGFSTIAEEKSPLVQLAKETIISLDYVGVSSFLNVNIGAQGTYTPTSPAKKDINQKDLKDSLADGLGEDDEESMDWWTKYFASVDLMIKVGELRDRILKKVFQTRRVWPTGLRACSNNRCWERMWRGGKVVRL